jgi:hypothetical protein
MPEDQQPVAPVQPLPNATANAIITQAGPFDLMLDEDFSEDFLDDDPDDDVDVSDVPGEVSFDELDEDDDLGDFVDTDDDDDALFAAPAAVGGGVPVIDDATHARLAKLEDAARSLAAAETDRENRRIRRKVTASTTGAGASGLIPLALSLLGVFHLDPELTAALSTAASLIGAFAAGYIVPERTPPLPSDAAQTLMALGPDATP